MAHYDLPTNSGFETFNLTRESRNAVSESPFTFQRQVLTYPGQRWVADVTLPPLERARADVWRAFLTRLNGSEHTFDLSDPLSAQPKGLIGGTPLINGANQTGQTLQIDGCTPNRNGWLLAGDYVQVGGPGNLRRLHMVLEDVNTNDSGQATLNLWPRMVTARPDNFPLVVVNAKGTFRLVGDSQVFETTNNSFTRISFTAVSEL